MSPPTISTSNGKWQEYVGGYSDWLAQRPALVAAAPAKTKADPKSAATPTPPTARLSYKESRELEQLPKEIEQLEQEQQGLTARMSSADYHRQGPDQMKADRKRAQDIEALLLEKFDRWEALEARRGS
jgi:ATP-binding cassette subfamily F protein uup